MADAAVEQTAQSRAKVFISYSRKDMEFADRLDAALWTRGFEPLIDRTDILAFEEWWKRVEALIGRADTVVFVLSPDAVRPDSVARKEVAFAASLNKRFAPIVFRTVEDKSIPEELAKLNFIFFDDAARFEQSADKLAVALQTDIGWIRKHTEYGEAARRWAAAGRPGPRGLLLRSPALEEAERWITSRPHNAPAPTEETQAFVTESRREVMRRRQRALALVGVFIAAMIAGLAAWWNQDWLKERMYALTSVHTLSAVQEAALGRKDSFKECTDCPEMIVVPAGSFQMGSTEDSGDVSEHPQHKVTIARPFAVSTTKITRGQWEGCVLNGPCGPLARQVGEGGRDLTWGVSWLAAGQYVQWLSRVTGQPYRLLSESEWEYVAKAGAATSNELTDDDSSKPNAFGIILDGLVNRYYEWCEDNWHPDYRGAPDDGSVWKGDNSGRVLRNFSLQDGPASLLVGRIRSEPDTIDFKISFRIARTIVHFAP